MPNMRADIDTDLLERTVRVLADRLEDGQLHRARSGFANAVYLGDRYVYKLVPLLADGSVESSKERTILALLDKTLPSLSCRYLPKLVHSTQLIPGVGTVDVYTKLPGSNVDQLTDIMCNQLGRFLADLHGCTAQAQVTEFDGGQGFPSFRAYAVACAEKYTAKLRKEVSDPGLLHLVAAAHAAIEKTVAEIAEPGLVILHKDLFGGNLLADAGLLSGIIDWEAAQSGPREWEFAILRQRYPNEWESIAASYRVSLDPALLDLCGLLQSLRFWKSFPHQDNFVRQQVEYLRLILEG